jgi:hypothetical protein
MSNTPVFASEPQKSAPQSAPNPAVKPEQPGHDDTKPADKPAVAK